jgi:flagellar biosynthesis protein FliR
MFISILYGLINEKSPIFSVFAQSFSFDILPALSSLHDVFFYMVEIFCSGSSHGSSSFKC